MSDLTDRLDAIQTRKDAATPGPWEIDVDGDDEGFEYGGPWEAWEVGPLALNPDCDWREEQALADIQFIANAPSDVAFLLDLARKQQAALEAVRALASEDEWGRVYLDTMRDALGAKP